MEQRMGASERPDVPPHGYPSAWSWTPPPGWPQPDPAWRPHAGWQPDPAWPLAPSGWTFWAALEPSAELVEDSDSGSKSGPADSSLDDEVEELRQDMQRIVQQFADQTMRKLTHLARALQADIATRRQATPGIRAAATELGVAERLLERIGNNPSGSPTEIMQKFVDLEASLKKAARFGGYDYSKL